MNEVQLNVNFNSILILVLKFVLNPGSHRTLIIFKIDMNLIEVL